MRKLLGSVCLLITAWSVDASACSCGGWPTPEQALRDSTAVFEGVVEKKTPLLASDYGFWFVVERWTFRVERSWKGPSDQVEVTEGNSNCSEIYALGERALVYAYQRQSRGELGSSKCNAPNATSLHEQMAFLGQPAAVHERRAAPRELAIARISRHARVYMLASIAAARNAVVRRDDEFPHARGYAVVAAGALLLLCSTVFAFVRRLRRIAAVALLVAAVVFVTAVLYVGRREVEGGYFAHLIEVRCPGCPGGGGPQ